MLAQVVERIRGRAGVNAFDGVLRRLFRGLLLQAFAPVKNGQIVMRGQIVRIDGLQRLELCNGLLGAILLVVRDAEFAARIAAIGILRDNFFQVGFLGRSVARAALDQREIVKGTSIVRMQHQRHLQRRARIIVLLPVQIVEAYVDEAVLVAGIELDHMLEGIERVLMLQLVQQADAHVVPAHPVGIVAGLRRVRAHSVRY